MSPDRAVRFERPIKLVLLLGSALFGPFRTPRSRAVGSIVSLIGAKRRQTVSPVALVARGPASVGSSNSWLSLSLIRHYYTVLVVGLLTASFHPSQQRLLLIACNKSFPGLALGTVAVRYSLIGANKFLTPRCAEDIDV